MKDSQTTDKKTPLRSTSPDTKNSPSQMGIKSITSDPETPSDEVNERNQEIQEEKIHDVSERNDTMHNPAMEIGKSYVVTTEDAAKTAKSE